MVGGEWEVEQQVRAVGAERDRDHQLHVFQQDRAEGHAASELSGLRRELVRVRSSSGDGAWARERALSVEKAAFTESSPVAHAANALLNAFKGATTLTVKKIAQDEAFMKATFDGQKSALVQCVRYMMEQGVVALVEDGGLTEDSVFVLKDGKEDKRNVKELRLARLFQAHLCDVWLESLDWRRDGEDWPCRCLCLC